MLRTKGDQDLVWAGFHAKVHKFDKLGNLTLHFAQRIIPTPEEVFSKWDFEYTKSVLFLRVLPGEGQDASKTLIRRYNITQWTDSKVVLSVAFQDPIWISSGEEADRIEVVFLKNEWFRGKDDARLSVHQNLAINGTIQSQLPPGDYTENL